MLKKLKEEVGFFKSQPHNFQILVLTNLVYAFVLPVIDIFVAAYVMRNSNDPTKVVITNLPFYTGIPLTFLLNGFLLKHFNIRKLYSAGMMLSEFAYILNHEAGLYVGRFLGAGTFIALAYAISTEFALRYAIIIIALLQLCSIFVAKKIIARGKILYPEEANDEAKVLNEVAEDMV